MDIWLEHDPVALAVLVIGLGAVELLAFIIWKRATFARENSRNGSTANAQVDLPGREGCGWCAPSSASFCCCPAWLCSSPESWSRSRGWLS